MKILIAEDEPSLQQNLQWMLELEGYEVATACDGREGFAQACAARPDLVITDFHMPGYDLIATLRALRRRWPLLPVLVMSGLVGEEAAIQVLKAGASDFLPKSRAERLSMVIDRELAEAGHYPAIDIERSISRVMTNVAKPPHIDAARRCQSVRALRAMRPSTTSAAVNSAR